MQKRGRNLCVGEGIKREALLSKTGSRRNVQEPKRGLSTTPSSLSHLSYLFDSDRLGQVSGTVDVAAAENGDVVREQLHWNHRQDSLEAVDSVRHFDELRGVFLRLQVALLADDYGATLAGCHLLKGVNAFLNFESQKKLSNDGRCFFSGQIPNNLRRRRDRGWRSWSMASSYQRELTVHVSIHQPKDLRCACTSTLWFSEKGNEKLKPWNSSTRFFCKCLPEHLPNRLRSSSLDPWPTWTCFDRWLWPIRAPCRHWRALPWFDQPNASNLE